MFKVHLKPLSCLIFHVGVEVGELTQFQNQE